MDVNNLANSLFNFQTVYFCLAIYVLTYLVRRLFEGIWKVLGQGGSKKGVLLARIWAEIVVPVLPIVLGGLLSFAAKTFVWPDFAMKTKLARVVYGSICGLFSAFIYNRIRGWLKSGIAATAGDATEPSGLVDPVLDGSMPSGLRTVEPPKADSSKTT